MRPRVICHMVTSLDGGLHPSRFTASPDGSRSDWSSLYEQIHLSLEPDAWLVGRITMAEMSKAAPHPPAHFAEVERPHHFAAPDAGSYAIALDPFGKLHFDCPDIGGDHVLVLLGKGVSDHHLAELAADGVSYVVAEAEDMDLAALLDVLGRKLGIRRLLLEVGATINGSFFAAGLVDELSLLVAPALNARVGGERFVAFGENGLAGNTQLSLTSYRDAGHGVLHLRYSVGPG